MRVDLFDMPTQSRADLWQKEGNDVTNQAYGERIKERVDSLGELRRKGVGVAAEIVGKNLFLEDLFFCTTIDRCLQLIDGFTIMLQKRNLTCAGVLLRIQMDNCMRTYAFFIVEDRKCFVDQLVSGTPISKLRDKTGKRMSDGYLKEAVGKIEPRFEQVYNQASGYIHLSEKAFFQTVCTADKDKRLLFRVGIELPEEQNENLLECADAFIHYIQFHYMLLNEVAKSKQAFDLSCDE